MGLEKKLQTVHQMQNAQNNVRAFLCSIINQFQLTAERADERSADCMNITYRQNGDYLIPNIIIRTISSIRFRAASSISAQCSKSLSDNTSSLNSIGRRSEEHTSREEMRNHTKISQKRKLP